MSPYLGVQAWAPALGQLYPPPNPPVPTPVSSVPLQRPRKGSLRQQRQVRIPSGDLAVSLCPNRLAGLRPHRIESSLRTHRARCPWQRPSVELAPAAGPPDPPAGKMSASNVSLLRETSRQVVAGGSAGKATRALAAPPRPPTTSLRLAFQQSFVCFPQTFHSDSKEQK